MAKGFNRPKGSKIGSPGGGAGGGMMQQFQKMQEQMETVQAQLALETVTASVSGGAVKITMSGDQICKGVEIDAELLKDPDVELLQDLLMTAINQGLEKSRELQSERMGAVTGGLAGMLPPGMGF